MEKYSAIPGYEFFARFEENLSDLSKDINESFHLEFNEFTGKPDIKNITNGDIHEAISLLCEYALTENSESFEKLPDTYKTLLTIHEKGTTPSQRIQKRRSYLFLADAVAGVAAISLKAWNWERAISAYARANLFWGMYISTEPSMKISELALIGAKARLAKDPRQEDKACVRECWDLWQKDLPRYKGKADFARDMIEKYESLKSAEVIARWCREWENTTQPVK